MPTIALYNQSGDKINDLVLNDAVFGIEPNQQVIYDVVNAQRAAMRQERMIQKDAAKYAAAVVNRGDKKEPDGLVKDRFVLRSGEAAALCSARLPEVMLSN